MISVEPMTIGHLVKFRKNVREIDLEEIEKATGISFDNHLINMLSGCMTLIDKKNTVLGIGGIDAETKTIWLVTTKAIEKRKVEFLRFSKRYLSEVLETHHFLCNCVYTKNKLHVDFLRWLGAQIEFIPNKEFLYFVFKKGG